MTSFDAEYVPIDLSALSNAGEDVFSAFPAPMRGNRPGPPRGRTTLRGIPFLIGAQEETSDLFVMAFDGSDVGESRHISIELPAVRLVFAHTLLETRVLEGEGPGAPVARYTMEFDDGSADSVIVRERFEIGAAPIASGAWPLLSWPFLAVPDQMPPMPPRMSGPWELAQVRHTGVGEPDIRAFWLWAWTNPRVGGRITSVLVEPLGRAFVLGGITAVLGDEHPLINPPSRRVLVDLAGVPGEGNDVALLLDRGQASYPRRVLMPTSPGGVPGWGLEADGGRFSFEVAALESAQVRLTVGATDLASVRWNDLRTAPHHLPRAGKLQVVEDRPHWVRIEVIDDASGKSVPCRIGIRSHEGISYQPHGHSSEINSGFWSWNANVGGDVRLGAASYAYIDGRCEGWVPRQGVIEVARGFEYQPLAREYELRPDQSEIVIRIRRWRDMNALGWFSGDSHVHFLSTQAALFEAAAEGLNVVNLLQSQWGSLFTSAPEFTGRPISSGDGQHVVFTSQENRQHLLGHLTLWGLESPVMPWATGGPSEAEFGSHLETSLSHWADAARARGGTVIAPHFPEPNGEVAALVATGRVDAIEMVQQDRYSHLEYYRYLNNGYRLPLVGGTDKMSAEVPVGLYRTYARLEDGEEFSYQGWCRAVRAGRTFLSGGPLLSLEVEGSGPGESVALPGPGHISVVAEAESIFPIHTLQLIIGGEVRAETRAEGGTQHLSLAETVEIGHSTWIAVRCGGPDYGAMTHLDEWRRGIFAHTSPVYIAVAGREPTADPDVVAYMRTLIEGSILFTRRAAQGSKGAVGLHHHGEGDHEAFLVRPLLEALEALGPSQRG